MKEIKSFKIGDEIPSDAKFICAKSDSILVGHEETVTSYACFFYEVPIRKDMPADSKLKSQTKAETERLIDDVLNYLNSVTGRDFKLKTKAHRDLVRARVNDGHDLGSFKKVIDKKTSEWIEDGYWNQFLRPATLFCAKNFDGYLNSATPRDMTQFAFDELESHLNGDGDA